jgi:hypothetical protein
MWAQVCQLGQGPFKRAGSCMTTTDNAKTFATSCVFSYVCQHERNTPKPVLPQPSTKVRLAIQRLTMTSTIPVKQTCKSSIQQFMTSSVSHAVGLLKVARLGYEIPSFAMWMTNVAYANKQQERAALQCAAAHQTHSTAYLRPLTVTECVSFVSPDPALMLYHNSREWIRT